MRNLLAFAAAFTAAAFLALTARAVAPSVSPGSGGIGQTVALTNFGFDAVKKPKVKLVPHAGETGLKNAAMKVTAFTTTDITAEVTGGRAGLYDVTVTAAGKGNAPVTLPETFTILVPAPEITEPASAAAKAVVTIHGTLFGPSKGTVTIGGKKAKVKGWADDTIVVVVPKAASGAQPVVVTNKAGASTAALTLDVTAPAGGGGAATEYFRADLSGKGHFEVTNANPLAFSVTYDPAALQLTFGGTTQPNKGFPNAFISMLPLDVARATPYSIGLQPAFPVTTIATLAYQDVVGVTPKIHTASLGLPGAALTVTITGWDGTFLEGTFTGTLVDAVGGTPPITVTNGAFKVRRATGH